jgi:hypothetical protein
MRKTFTFAAATLAVAADLTALAAGLVLGLTSHNHWYFGYSVAAALAVFVAALIFNMNTGRMEAAARDSGRPFAGQQEALTARLRHARNAARPTPLPRHLMALPVLRCNTSARRRAA